MTQEKYNYYIVNLHEGWKGHGRSHLISFGTLHHNTTKWYNKMMHHAWEDFGFNDTANTGNRTISFSFMDPRIDEALSLAFDLKWQYNLLFIDGDDGMIYQWDKKGVHP